MHISGSGLSSRVACHTSVTYRATSILCHEHVSHSNHRTCNAASSAGQHPGLMPPHATWCRCLTWVRTPKVQWPWGCRFRARCRSPGLASTHAGNAVAFVRTSPSLYRHQSSSTDSHSSAASSRPACPGANVSLKATTSMHVRLHSSCSTASFP